MEELKNSYALLDPDRDTEIVNQGDEDDAAEAFLREHFSIDVDFEIDDAMAKLHRLGLSHRDPQGRWTAVSLDDALERLDHAWDNLFQYHQDDSSRRAA